MARRLKVNLPDTSTNQCNKLIELFMGGYNINMYHNVTFSSTQNYDTSWDALMCVIRKIKEHVFNEGYDIFMPEHSSYMAIGNACYDADLQSAWKAVVNWITLRFDIHKIDFEQGIKKNDGVVYKTKEKNLKITTHAIKRWKERIDEFTPVDIICTRVCTSNLLNSYKMFGDGKYYIGNGIAVAIDNFKVATIHKHHCNDSQINTKIA